MSRLRVKILSLLPKSCTVRKSRNGFNVSEYLVKKIKNLVEFHGILFSQTDIKLNFWTINKILNFYEKNKNSRVCFGKIKRFFGKKFIGRKNILRRTNLKTIIYKI